MQRNTYPPKNHNFLPPLQKVLSDQTQSSPVLSKEGRGSAEPILSFRSPRYQNTPSPSIKQSSTSSPRKNVFFNFQQEQTTPEYTSLKELRKQFSVKKEDLDKIEVPESEENILLKKHTRSLLYKMLSIPLDDIMQEGYMQKLERSIIEKIITYSEKILMLHGISSVMCLSSKIDSVIVIEPITDMNNLAQFYRTVMPEFCKFPYSFLKAIDLKVLTIADEVDLNKPESHPLVQRRLYNGLFPVKKFTKRSDAKLHFYKMIAFLLKFKYIHFDAEWVEITPPPTEVVLIYSGTRYIPKERDILEEQANFLFKLIDGPKGFFLSEDSVEVAQAELFQHILEEVDPVGITESWWRELENPNKDL